MQDIRSLQWAVSRCISCKIKIRSVYDERINPATEVAKSVMHRENERQSTSDLLVNHQHIKFDLDSLKLSLVNQSILFIDVGKKSWSIVPSVAFSRIHETKRKSIPLVQELGWTMSRGLTCDPGKTWIPRSKRELAALARRKKLLPRSYSLSRCHERSPPQSADQYRWLQDDVTICWTKQMILILLLTLFQLFIELVSERNGGDHWRYGPVRVCDGCLVVCIYITWSIFCNTLISKASDTFKRWKMNLRTIPS